MSGLFVLKNAFDYHFCVLLKFGKSKTVFSFHALFSGSGDSENMPTTEFCSEDFFDDKISLVNIVVKCNFASSKGEAKRLIQQGGISVNDETVSAIDKTYTKSELIDGLKIRKGKKHFHKAIAKNL